MVSMEFSFFLWKFLKRCVYVYFGRDCACPVISFREYLFIWSRIKGIVISTSIYRRKQIYNSPPVHFLFQGKKELHVLNLIQILYSISINEHCATCNRLHSNFVKVLCGNHSNLLLVYERKGKSNASGTSYLIKNKKKTTTTQHRARPWGLHSP